MTMKLSVINVGQNHKLFSICNLCAQDLTETLGPWSPRNPDFS